MFLPFVYCDDVRNDDGKAISTFFSRSINLALYMVYSANKKKGSLMLLLELEQLKMLLRRESSRKSTIFFLTLIKFAHCKKYATVLLHLYFMSTVLHQRLYGYALLF
jgi:hypothetical protein